MNQFTSKNNYANFKTDFEKDTGLKFKDENIAIYIQYYNARVSDNQLQLQSFLLAQIHNRLIENSGK